MAIFNSNLSCCLRNPGKVLRPDGKYANPNLNMQSGVANAAQISSRMSNQKAKSSASRQKSRCWKILSHNWSIQVPQHQQNQQAIPLPSSPRPLIRVRTRSSTFCCSVKPVDLRKMALPPAPKICQTRQSGDPKPKTTIFPEAFWRFCWPFGQPSFGVTKSHVSTSMIRIGMIQNDQSFQVGLLLVFKKIRESNPSTLKLSLTQVFYGWVYKMFGE